MSKLDNFIELDLDTQAIINYFHNSSRDEIIKFCEDNNIFCKKYFFTNKMRKNITEQVNGIINTSRIVKRYT